MWYDFAAYGYFVSLIAAQFFPEQDRTAGLLAAFGVFALGFLGRVGGGFLYGLISARLGRARALQLSVVLMAVSTVLMGVLPTYAKIGMLAPVLLTVLRLLQGLSIGGEFATSITMLAERADRKQRGLMSGIVGGAACAGFVLGASVAALRAWGLSPPQMHSWGWRIPFLSGSLLGLLAYLMRRQLLPIGSS